MSTFQGKLLCFIMFTVNIWFSLKSVIVSLILVTWVAFRSGPVCNGYLFGAFVGYVMYIFINSEAVWGTWSAMQPQFGLQTPLAWKARHIGRQSIHHVGEGGKELVSAPIKSRSYRQVTDDYLNSWNWGLNLVFNNMTPVGCVAGAWWA